MRAVWALVVSSVAQLLVSHMCGSAEVQVSTMPIHSVEDQSQTRSGLSTEKEEHVSEVTVTEATDDEGSTDASTVPPTPPSPVYSTGVVSASEFFRISEILNWFYLTLEPLALVLLVLSAVAFLQDRQFASNCYLAAICLFEAWYMLMLFTHYACRQYPECWTSLRYVQLSIWTVSYTGMAARRVVYIVNALVAFQRCVAVAFPFKVRSLRWLQKPRVPLVLVFFFSFLLHLYRPLQYIPIRIKDGKSARWTQGFSSLFHEHEETFLVLADLAKYLAIYIPMLLCLISNCVMIVALSRHNRDLSKINNAGSTLKEQDASKSKMERQMTVTIMTATFLMILLNTPININEAVSMYSDHYGMLKKDHYLYLVLRRCLSVVSQLCDLLVALTFLILSTAFRRRFLALFRPLCRVVCPGSAGRFSSTTETSVTAAHSARHTSTMDLASVTRG